MEIQRREYPWKQFLLLLLIFFSSGVLGYFSLKDGHDWGGDFALYIRQTESLLEGNVEELLALNTYSMENSTLMKGANPHIGPNLYPWGFPLLLLPIYALFGANIMIMKVYIMMYFMLSLLVVYHLFKSRLGWKNSMLLVALLGLNPYLVQFSDVIVSDIPYLFLALLSMLFIQRVLEGKYFINKTTTYVLTGIFMLFAFLVRTNGIVLPGVLFLSQVIKYWPSLRSGFSGFIKQHTEELLPYVSFAGAYLFFKLLLPGGSGSHLEFLLRVTPGKLAYNLMYYTELPAEFYTGVLFPKLLFGITIPFLLLGVYRAILKDYHYLLYSLATLAVFIIWPPIQGLRFIFSLLPFYLYFTFIGLAYAEELLRTGSVQYTRRYTLHFVQVFGFIILFMFLYRSSLDALTNIKSNRSMLDGPYTAESQEVFTYVRDSVEDDAIVVFFKPRVMSFITRKQSLRILTLDEIKQGKGDYLVFHKKQSYGQLEPEELEELLKERTPAFENDAYLVIKLRDTASGFHNKTARAKLGN